MGLDMYLTQRVYVGAEYAHRKVRGTIELTAEGQPLAIDLKRVSVVDMSAGYWRKANAIHKWFVDHCQEGRDECQEVEVDYGELVELRDLCKKVLETKDTSLLPPQDGFFFGGTEIDDWYWQDLKDTVKIIGKLDPEGHYVYQSSW